MIFVTVGSLAFDELIKKIDELIEKNKIREKVLMQIGDGSYKPKNAEFYKYKPSLQDDYKNADLIITHSGASTLIETIKLGKKIICVPNKKAAKNPDIVIKFSKENYILVCNDLNNIEEFLEKIKTFKPEKFKEIKCHIHERILEFLYH